MRLLLIEDNARLATLIRDGLQVQGFAVDWCDNLKKVELLQQLVQYDLLLLDLGLPDGNGLSLIYAMRRRKDMTPILIITARGELDDRVAGLDAGADDYLCKPFQLPELVSRCRALLRRPGASLGTILCAGNVLFDSAERTLLVSDYPVDATPREIDLLEHLLRHVGHVVPRSMLENALYSMEDEVTPNALEASVSRLRKRLKIAAANVQIRTIHGIGYALFEPR
nr:response regulator transcription factor [uncultured Halomonas sp.]